MTQSMSSSHVSCECGRLFSSPRGLSVHRARSSVQICNSIYNVQLTAQNVEYTTQHSNNDFDPQHLLFDDHLDDDADLVDSVSEDSNASTEPDLIVYNQSKGKTYIVPPPNVSQNPLKPINLCPSINDTYPFDSLQEFWIIDFLRTNSVSQREQDRFFKTHYNNAWYSGDVNIVNFNAAKSKIMNMLPEPHWETHTFEFNHPIEGPWNTEYTLYMKVTKTYSYVSI